MQKGLLMNEMRPLVLIDLFHTKTLLLLLGVQGVLISKKMWIIVKEKERSDLRLRLSFPTLIAY